MHGVLSLALSSALIAALHGAATAAAESLQDIMRTTWSQRVAAPPAIDGKLDDACWREADAQGWFFGYGGDGAAGQQTDVRSVHDARRLYFGFRCRSADLGSLKITVRDRDRGSIWTDDCVELFLQPGGPGRPYCHFIVNPAATLYDTRSDSSASAWNSQTELACETLRETGPAGHWTVEMAIPFADLGGAPAQADTWRVNYCRTENAYGELSTWMPLPSGGFAQPERFGRLAFRAPTAAEQGEKLALARKLQADRVGTGGDASKPLELRPNGPLRARKLAVADCRVVRGFTAAPVDGTLRSRNYHGGAREYPTRGVGAGVSYWYNQNDGLHITLEQPAEFDTVVLRGGARTRMYAGVQGLREPEATQPLWTFPGGAGVQTARFDTPVRAERLSFFGTRGGMIGDVSFYRTATGAAAGPEAKAYAPAARPAELPARESEFDLQNLGWAMKERYGDTEPRARMLAPTDGPGATLALPANTAVHLVTDPFESETGLTAVSIEGVLTGTGNDSVLSVVVQDPLNPRRDIAWLECATPKSGTFRMQLDIPDQILLKGSRLWLTLRASADLALASPLVLLHLASREQALPEALAWRKLLLRAVFGIMAEPRPWGGYKKQTREEFFKSSKYAGNCPELFMTIDQCHALDPADDLVRQYREWVYLRHLGTLSDVAPPPEPPAGVPAWAWYPRLAWLEFRRQTDWWMRERLVPTGELGTSMNDDTDLFQQLADVPFFESDGVGAKVKDAAARLAELAEQTTIEEGLNKRTMDSLHAYEEGINHLALMARWSYGDPIYVERCMASARSMERVTVGTGDGRRHIPDNRRIGAADLNAPRQPALDTHANPLMWHAALQAADYNHHPRILKVIREWADTWASYQKPGQWVTGIDVRTGAVKSFEKDRPLYGGYRAQAGVFTWLYALTADGRYIEPFLHYYRNGKAPLPANSYLPDVYALGGLDGVKPEALAKLAGFHAAAALLLDGNADPLMRQIIGRQRNWDAAIDNLIDARRWPDMYTTSHSYTDRVLMGDLLANTARAYLGGACKRNRFVATHAVSWEGFGTDYAALVLKNRRDGLKVLAYNHAERPLTGAMRIWALEHGTYTLSAGPDADGDHRMERAARTESLEVVRADRIPLTLPPKVVTVIELVQTRKRPPVHGCADLAIAAREVRVTGDTLSGTVHNIGCADVADTVVAVVDAGGRVLARKALGPLPAPLDLQPKRKDFTLTLPARPREGWKLVLDPAKSIPEIYEGNNEVVLDTLPAPDYARAWE
ncbi:MAG: carbohydrate-binding family 9-like protein [Kiritimatiellae bacterium]|nr:carbohydrate-binding family 9-like protein [Kiritimatiellia bacterium]